MSDVLNAIVHKERFAESTVALLTAVQAMIDEDNDYRVDLDFVGTNIIH